MRRFTLLWLGQLISGFGSSLSGFALGVWIYQQTGSATQFAITTLFYVLPYALLASIAGTLVDRWDRRKTMILADSGQALITLGLMFCLSTNRLDVWLIYLGAALSACFGSFQGPAYGASVSLLVPQDQLSRTAGMGQMSNAINRLLAPIVAGLLVVKIGLGGVFMLDLASFAVAIVTYLLVSIPKPLQTTMAASTQASLWQETYSGWRYLLDRPGLLGYVLVGALRNYFIGIVNALTVPLVLSMGQADQAGFVLAVGSMGLLVGGSLMSLWRGPKRRIKGYLGFLTLEGVGTAIAGCQPLIPLIAAGRAITNVGLAGGASTGTALEQSKIAPQVQGRVFGTIGMLSLVAEALAYPSAGVLADHIFEPFMSGSTWLSSVLQLIVGTGSGRGIGLMNVIVGACLVSLAAIAYRYPRIRQIEDELPNHTC